MSGKFNNPPPIWEPVSENRKSGKFGLYYEMGVIFITPRGDVLLTPKTFKSINSPEYVTLVKNGDNQLGIMACPKDSKFSYKVGLRSRTALLTLNMKTALRKVNLLPPLGQDHVYKVAVLNGVLVLDKYPLTVISNNS